MSDIYSCSAMSIFRKFSRSRSRQYKTGEALFAPKGP
jgi:hypothetical protein